MSEKLRPHERKILNNEFLKEQEIQNRLNLIIDEEIREKELLALYEVSLVLREKGYTKKDVEESDTNSVLKKLIWDTIKQKWSLFSQIPPKRLKLLLGISDEEIEKYKNLK